MDHCLPGKKVFAGPEGLGREKQPLREIAIVAAGPGKSRVTAFIVSELLKNSTRWWQMKGDSAQ